MTPLEKAVQYQRISPNRFEVAVESATPQLLVVSENWYPGWKALVNGRPQPIYRAYGVLMGVFIEPGSSRVMFTYRPTHFYWGVFLALGAFLILLLSLVQTFVPGRQGEDSRAGQMEA
ncbi:MAG: YfhO family protein [Terriglobia bacterium]